MCTAVFLTLLCASAIYIICILAAHLCCWVFTEWRYDGNDVLSVICRILDSHSSGFEELYHLGYNAV
jgi:hypothetical protein